MFRKVLIVTSNNSIDRSDFNRSYFYIFTNRVIVSGRYLSLSLCISQHSLLSLLVAEIHFQINTKILLSELFYIHENFFSFVKLKVRLATQYEIVVEASWLVYHKCMSGTFDILLIGSIHYTASASNFCASLFLIFFSVKNDCCEIEIISIHRLLLH